MNEEKQITLYKKYTFIYPMHYQRNSLVSIPFFNYNIDSKGEL